MPMKRVRILHTLYQYLKEKFNEDCFNGNSNKRYLAGSSCRSTAICRGRAWNIQHGYTTYFGQSVRGCSSIGVEVAYTDLGNYRDSSSSALSLALTGTLPLGSTWDILGKWGASQNHTNYAGSNKTDSMFGFGIGYNVSPIVALRFEYEDFGKFPTDPDGTSTLATSKGLSVRYSF